MNGAVAHIPCILYEFYNFERRGWLLKHFSHKDFDVARFHLSCTFIILNFGHMNSCCNCKQSTHLLTLALTELLVVDLFIGFASIDFLTVLNLDSIVVKQKASFSMNALKYSKFGII